MRFKKGLNGHNYLFAVCARPTESSLAYTFRTSCFLLPLNDGFIERIYSFTFGRPMVVRYARKLLAFGVLCFATGALAQIAAPEERCCSELQKKSYIIRVGTGKSVFKYNIIDSVCGKRKKKERKTIKHMVGVCLPGLENCWKIMLNVMRSPKCNEYQLGFTRGLNAQQSWTKHALCILIFCLKGAGDLIKGFIVFCLRYRFTLHIRAINGVR